MRHRERLLGIAVILALLVFARVAHQTYRWYAHDEERARIEALSALLEDVGLRVVTTQLAGDSLRALVEQMDRGLAGTRAAIAAYERHAVGGALPAHLYGAYRGDLDAHNRRVVERNARFEQWREAVGRNHAAVTRFNSLADSIRVAAAAMGEPYYSIPTPAEIALEHGLVPRR
jgi:hypothetical protein